MTIDRCICTNRSFAELKAIAEREQLTLSELSTKTQCGRGCGWCVAYLKRVFQTGETVFCEMLPKESFDEENKI